MKLEFRSRILTFALCLFEESAEAAPAEEWDDAPSHVAISGGSFELARPYPYWQESEGPPTTD